MRKFKQRPKTDSKLTLDGASTPKKRGGPIAKESVDPRPSPYRWPKKTYATIFQDAPFLLPGEQKISPKLSCIKFFWSRDVPTQIAGHPGHFLSKTTEKGALRCDPNCLVQPPTSWIAPKSIGEGVSSLFGGWPGSHENISSNPKVAPVQVWGCSRARDIFGTPGPSSKKTTCSFSYRFRGNPGSRGCTRQSGSQALRKLGVPPWSLFLSKHYRDFKVSSLGILMFRGTCGSIWPDFGPVLTNSELFCRAGLTYCHLFRPIRTDLFSPISTYFVSQWGSMDGTPNVKSLPGHPRAGPQSADKKFVRARGPQNWNPEVFDQARCSRILRVEFALNIRELVKAEVFKKRMFEQTTPLKWRKLRGHFPWTAFL